MTCLGSQLSALADGQLAPAEAERAMAHVVVCPGCAAGLSAARAARRALSGAQDVPIDPGLTARLLAMGCRPEPSAAGPANPWRFPDASVPLPGTGTGRRLPAAGLDRPHSPARWLLAASAGVGVVAVALATLGAQPDVVPTAHPAHALTLLSRAGSNDDAPAPVPAVSMAGAASAAVAWSGRAPAASATTSATLTTDPPQWPDRHGWSAPSTLPQGYEVTGVRQDVDGSSGLELDLTGPQGTIVVTEQHGRIDPVAVEAATPAVVSGYPVQMLSDAPWHVVWQAGDTVVSVVAETESDAANAVVAAYPHADYDDDVLARLARGWSVVAGSWGP